VKSEKISQNWNQKLNCNKSMNKIKKTLVSYFGIKSANAQYKLNIFQVYWNTLLVLWKWP